MIERSIAQKVEEAKSQGWPQSILSRFLETSFRLARICGLTDTLEQTTDNLLTREERNWSQRVERLIDLGFHVELGIGEDEYRASIPPFQTQPEKFKGHFDVTLLVDPRVSLQRQLELYKVEVEHHITEADITRLSMRQATKQYIPKEPYQLWVRAELRSYEERYRSREVKLRTVGEFAYNERGLTAIEGLALLREYPGFLYNALPKFDQHGLYLLDEVVGEKRVLTLKPIGETPIHGRVAVLEVEYASEYTSSYNLVSCGKLPKK